MGIRDRCAVSALAWALAGTVVLAAYAQTPRGEAILFVSDHEGENGFYLMNPYGSRVREFLPQVRWPGMPMWSSNGRKIAFVLYPAWPGVGRAHVMDADGGDLQELTKVGEWSSHPALSPRGQRVAFHALLDGIVNIYVAEARGAKAVPITNRVDPAGGWRPSSQPAWSPDGTRIAFVASKHNNGQAARYIWTMNPDGSDMRELVAHESRNDTPAYSPNGSRIAFVSDRDGASEIYTIGSDGARLRRVTGMGEARWPRWSPDGTRIVFHSGPEGGVGGREIHVIDASGRNLKQLTDFGGRSWYADWYDPAADVDAAARQALMWGWLKRLR